MRPEELAAAGELAADAAAEFTARVRETHEAIARRAFGAAGAASPVKLVHDGIAGLVYGSVAGLTRLGLRHAGRMLAVAVPEDAPALEAGRGGRRVVAALNGAAGDRLHDRHSPLELKLSLCQNGTAVPLTEEGLAAAFPGATPRLAVFVHGLGQSEDTWNDRDGRTLYPRGLSQRFGMTPLLLRYNSGRPVAENGFELAALLERLVQRWPVEVQEITLVGHAHGALVCHRACEMQATAPWVARVRHIVALGAPHRGAVVESVTRAASSALRRLPETRAAGRALELRSAGIKDGGGGEIQFLPHVRYLFVSASILRGAPPKWGARLGDLVVSRDSAWAHPGNGAAMRFPVESYREIGGLGHFELAHHPVVMDQIVGWLVQQHPELPPARPALADRRRGGRPDA